MDWAAKTIQPIQQYMEKLKLLMGLSDYEVHVSSVFSSDSHAWATVKRVRNKQDATIWLCKDFFDQTQHQIRETVVHELLHLHVEPIDWAKDNIDSHLAPPVKALFGETIDDEIERLVDRLAKFIAPKMPLYRGNQ